MLTLKIQEAKENWMEEKCYELEELQRKHDDFNVHEKIKELKVNFHKTCLYIVKKC